MANIVPIDPGKRPVLQEDDIDRVTDFYFPCARSENVLEDAWCYCGTPMAIPIEGSPLEEDCKDLVQQVFEQTQQAREDQAQQIRNTAQQIAQARQTDDKDQQVTDTDLQAAVNLSLDQYQQLERRLREPRLVTETAIYRARWNRTSDQDFLNLRRLPRVPPRLNELHMPDHWKAALQHDYPSGLILICGKYGSGKSTTLAATVVSNLREKGGFAYMVEDPPEFFLQGRHKNGMCIQSPVITTWEEALNGSTRIFPSVPNTSLIFGEIRDQVCATHALEQADNGQTVLATLHAGSAVGAIERLATLVATTMGERQPYKILSNTLRCVIYQRLVRKKTAGGSVKTVLEGEMLYFPDGEQGSRNQVKDPEQILQLRGVISKQHNQFEQAKRSGKSAAEVLRELDQANRENER